MGEVLKAIFSESQLTGEGAQFSPGLAWSEIDLAMGQNPNRTPSEHPNPHYNRPKWVVNSPTPKWDPIGFDHRGHLFNLSGANMGWEAEFTSPYNSSTAEISEHRTQMLLTKEQVELYTQDGTDKIQMLHGDMRKLIAVT